ncbi:MAG: FHA domain-containing protein, partial [Candidatus Sulfotelmatobacter sp.]
MRPRLLVLSGPLKDSTIPLNEGEIAIGREASSGISVSDPSVSRKHFLIRLQDGRVLVRDLDSRNGTLVNGSPVEEQWLQHGDTISAGDSSFLFLLKEDDLAQPAGEVEFDDSRLTAETTIIHPKDVVYLQPEKLLRELPPTSNVARNLNALLKISGIIHAIRDLEELQAQLLDLIFEVVPAGRGAILLADSQGQEFNSLFARMRESAKAPLVKVSRTVARQVMEQGVAMLSSDVMASDGLRQVESLAALEVRSLICVPLTVFQRRIGCIYLDNDTLAGRLNEEHLQLVTAIAGLSAVALENARRLHWLEQENERLIVEVTQDRSLIGEGARIREIYQFLRRVAPTEGTVLIEGESGTGKELAARAIHRN